MAETSAMPDIDPILSSTLAFLLEKVNYHNDDLTLLPHPMWLCHSYRSKYDSDPETSPMHYIYGHILQGTNKAHAYTLKTKKCRVRSRGL